ncbi:MAG: hypothetical protein IT458_19950 [Planctomycetes bacterium]|nr:hypothetical protein [Planctomycetota bacterium]
MADPGRIVPPKSSLDPRTRNAKKGMSPMMIGILAAAVVVVLAGWWVTNVYIPNRDAQKASAAPALPAGQPAKH